MRVNETMMRMRHGLHANFLVVGGFLIRLKNFRVSVQVPYNKNMKLVAVLFHSFLNATETFYVLSKLGQYDEKQKRANKKLRSV